MLWLDNRSPMTLADKIPGIVTRTLFVMVLVLAAGKVCHAGGQVTLDPSTISRYAFTRNGEVVIHLPKGVYRVAETLRLPSHTTLEGEGSGTVLQAVSPFRGERFITNADSARGNSDITVTSLAVDYHVRDYQGDYPGILRFEQVQGLRLTDLTMEIDSSYYGIDLASAVRDALISGCTITNKGSGGGVMVRNRNPAPLHATSNIAIRGNRLSSGVQDEPVAVFGWMGRVEKVNVSENILQARGASFGISVFAIDQRGHTGSICLVNLVGNSIEGGNVGGIAVKGGAREVEITGNTIHGAKNDGIFIHPGGEALPAADQVTVRNNEISAAGRHCIFAAGSNLSIFDNAISNCGESGVYVGGQVKVIGNTIANAHPGILVDTDKNSIVEGNTLTNASGITVLRKGTLRKIGNLLH